MALNRRSGQRFEANIWPGFVDAMTALLLVLVFILSIFMIMQFMLSETINNQDTELDQLNEQVNSLADALGLEQQRGSDLEDRVGQLDDTLRARAAELEAEQNLVATLRTEAADQATRISSFEEQVAGLLSDRDRLRGQVATLEGERDEQQAANATLSAKLSDIEAGLARELSAKEAAQLALAQAREEIDEGANAARLAAARREALEALVADLETSAAETSAALSETEAARLADAAAAEALRDRLKNSDAELTAMTLILEEERQKAEDTLTLLAAANAARERLEQDLSVIKSDTDAQLTEAQKRAALLATAQSELSIEKAISAEAQRRVAALNQQMAALRTQLGSLQGLLDAAVAEDQKNDVQLQALGTQLNAALAQAASEQRRRASLEEAERKRLEAEAKELKNYRSEFFGQLRELLGDQEGVRIEGDRFVFSSEVLFRPARAELSEDGRWEIAKVASILRRVAGDIPDELDWVIRVDGHTDNQPLSSRARYRDNWELSQARALSVVRYMSDELGIPPERLAANGFGEFQPINTANTPEAYAQNRRIELKLTER